VRFINPSKTGNKCMKSIGLKHEIFANVAGLLCLKNGLMIEDVYHNGTRPV
jgi:hypothetical protein